MAKILILGAAGFIGSNFANSFMLQPQGSYDVFGVDNASTFESLTNLKPLIKSKRFKLNLSDVSDFDIMCKLIKFDKPDIIINNVSFLGGSALKHLVAFAKENDVSRFISIINEDDGHIKIEDDLHNYLRFSQVFGPRQHISRLVPSTIKSALNPHIGNSVNIEHDIFRWLYIQDAFRALLTIIENGKPGLRYQVNSGFTLSTTELFKQIYGIVGAQSPDISVLGQAKIRNFDPSFVNMNELGWKPQFKFNDALEHTVEWYSVNKWAFER